MAKKRKQVKEQKENKKTYIVIGVTVAILIAFMLVQTIGSFRQMDYYRCIVNLIVISEAMDKMAGEYVFPFDPEKQSSDTIIKSLVVHLHSSILK